MAKRGRITGGGIRGFIEFRDLYPEVAAKELRAAVKQANIDTVLFWHRTFLPRHFETGARQRYTYEPRTEKYRRQKRRMIARGVAEGPPRPLVLTGQMKRNAIRRMRATGTSNKATGTMTGTQVANFNRGQGNRPNVREEMLVTVPAEEKKMRRFHERTVKKELDQVRGRRTQRV